MKKYLYKTNNIYLKDGFIIHQELLFIALGKNGIKIMC